jgi:hypothetical protein
MSSAAGFMKSVRNSIAQILFLICPKQGSKHADLKITSANAESTNFFSELRVTIPLTLPMGLFFRLKGLSHEIDFNNFDEN